MRKLYASFDLELFKTKSKVELSQIGMFCQRFNATIPYPKTYQENRDYRKALNSINTSSSVTTKSCHAIVELKPNGNWNPFPTSRLINVTKVA